MKTRFHHEDLLYGVVLAAVLAFVFATLLDGMRVGDLAGGQAVAATTVVARSVAAVASATHATSATR